MTIETGTKNITSEIPAYSENFNDLKFIKSRNKKIRRALNKISTQYTRKLIWCEYIEIDEHKTLVWLSVITEYRFLFSIFNLKQ